MVHADVRWMSLLAVLVTAVFGAIVVVPLAAPAGAVTRTFPTGTFETHRDGFQRVGPSRVALSREGAGRAGTRALRIRTTRRGPAIAQGTHRFSGVRTAGTTYVIRAWVRASAPRRVALRVREGAAGRILQERISRASVGRGGWTRVTVRITTKVANSTLRLRFRTPYLRIRDRLFVDDLRMTVVPPAASAGRLSNGCGRTARGIPSCGTYVGAAHGSNTDPRALESDLGGQLGVRRTYFTSTGVAKAVETARLDLAAGRLPWVSFKLPYSWSEMAAGRGDAWARDLAQRLGALRGPVWVAFHHEPEGDGNIQDWRRMQERLAPIVRGTAPTVGFTVIMTGWHQFYGDQQYRLSEIWPRGVAVDVAGFDIYQQYGVVKDGTMTTKWTSFEQYYSQISTWARANGVAWALGETGVTHTAALARPAEITNAVTLMTQYGGVAYSYFDSALNSVAPWGLEPDGKRAAFARALDGSPTLVP